MYNVCGLFYGCMNNVWGGLLEQCVGGGLLEQCVWGGVVGTMCAGCTSKARGVLAAGR